MDDSTSYLSFIFTNERQEDDAQEDYESYTESDNESGSEDDELARGG